VTKRRELDRLEQEIKEKFPTAWLYPKLGKVQGFSGAGPLMFVGERPSTGTFPSPSDRRFYRILEELGVEDSHLTDIIKARGRVNDPYPKDMSLHKRFFMRELRIVRPKKVIAFGQKVYDLLQFSLADDGIKVRRVWHYTYLRRVPSKTALYKRQLRKAISE
jgi:uracil-DNA glycosylase